MYYANLQLTPEQASKLLQGKAITIRPYLITSPNAGVIVNENNAKKLLTAESKGGAMKLKLSPSEIEYNVNSVKNLRGITDDASMQTKGGIGPLAMLAASSLIPAVAPAVGNLANNLFGKLFGGSIPASKRGRRRRM
jgi:hypothetical protein